MSTPEPSLSPPPDETHVGATTRVAADLADDLVEAVASTTGELIATLGSHVNENGRSSDESEFTLKVSAASPRDGKDARVALAPNPGPGPADSGGDALEMALEQLCASHASALQHFRTQVASLRLRGDVSSATRNGTHGDEEGPVPGCVKETTLDRQASPSRQCSPVEDAAHRHSSWSLPVNIENACPDLSPAGVGERSSTKLSWSSANGQNEDGENGNRLIAKLERLIFSPVFESSVALLIFCNTIVMAVEAQWSGLQTGYAIKFYETGKLGWHGAEAAFDAMEFIFGCLFAAELLVKIICLRHQIVKDLWNWLDTVIVAAWCLTEFGGGSAAESSPVDPSLLRLVRLVRLLRLVRLMHYMRGFDSLLIMTTAIRGSISILLWTGVVLTLALMLCALMLQATCENYLAQKDPEHRETRELVYMYYGTFSRSFLTMFELTMGNWMPPCRALVENVSEWFMIFFLLHKLIIGFSVLAVVNGVFMQETFKTANQNDHIMLLNRERVSKMHSRKMRALFDHLDDDCSGYLSLEEFKGVVDDPAVRNWLLAMELDVRDVDSVFELLDTDENGRIEVDELVTGVSHLKGAARAIDLATCLNEIKKLRRAAETEGRRTSTRARTSPGSTRKGGLAPLFSLDEGAVLTTGFER